MRNCSLLSLAFWASFALTAANAEPHPSQGLWTAVDRVPFPSSASPPTDYAAARLDLAAFLDRIGAEAPTVDLPLPDGSFARVVVRAQSPMAPEIAAAFPDLQNYVFRSLDGGVTGRLTMGPGGVYVSGRGENGLLRIAPIQTGNGVYYVSFFDCNRTDEIRAAVRTRPRWRRVAAALGGRDGVPLQHIPAPHHGMDRNVAALP